MQDCHDRLAGKDTIAIAAATYFTRALLLPPHFSISQNSTKDQALAALPPVAALKPGSAKARVANLKSLISILFY